MDTGMHKALGMEQEHWALIREWAGWQQRMDTLRDEQAQRVRQLERELMRLRAERVIRHTQWLWGMGFAGFARPGTGGLAARSSETDGNPARQRTQAVICQTGCISQAHAWLDDEHQCRLLGGTCEQQPTTPENPCA